MDETANDNKKAVIERWVCGYCDCVTFELLKGLRPVCANCGMSAGHVESGWMMDEDKRSKAKPEDTNSTIIGNGAIPFAKERMQRRIKEDGACLVIVAFLSGEVSCWSQAETKEQYEWAKSRIRIAESMLDVQNKGDE